MDTIITVIQIYFIVSVVIWVVLGIEYGTKINIEDQDTLGQRYYVVQIFTGGLIWPVVAGIMFGFICKRIVGKYKGNKNNG